VKISQKVLGGYFFDSHCTPTHTRTHAAKKNILFASVFNSLQTDLPPNKAPLQPLTLRLVI